MADKGALHTRRKQSLQLQPLFVHSALFVSLSRKLTHVGPKNLTGCKQSEQQGRRECSICGGNTSLYVVLFEGRKDNNFLAILDKFE